MSSGNRDFNDDRRSDDHGGRRNDDFGGDDNFSGNHKAFKFEIANNQVTAVYELKDGVLKPKSLDDHGTKSYTVDGNDVVRKEIKPFGTEITRYSDADGDGIFFRVSEQWQVSPNASGMAMGQELLTISIILIPVAMIISLCEEGNIAQVGMEQMILFSAKQIIYESKILVRSKVICWCLIRVLA